MAEETPKPNYFGSPMVLGLFVLVAIALWRAPDIIQAVNPPPVVNPDIPPGPQPFVSLSQRVKQAFSDSPDAALRYAALYAVAQGVVSDETRSPRQIQEEIGKAVKLMGLSHDELKPIVAQHLEPYSGTNPDRAAWAAAVKQLSEACRAAGG